MATRNIVPRANGEGSIGTAAKHWGAGHFDTLPNWQEYLAESTGYGIVSGCEPTISGLTVTVGAGVVHLADGTRKEISATNITLDAADSTNPRIDLVYIDSTGAVAKITGTAAASPSAPALPSGGISVCNVTIAAGASTGTVNRVQTIAPNLANYGVVNVKEFGAKGDGVTDDTAAIQAAIDYASVHKSEVFFEGVTYKVASLNMRSNVILSGAGRKSTVLKFTTDEAAINFEENVAYVVVQNMCISGNNSVNTEIGILFSPVPSNNGNKRVLIRNVQIEYFKGVGLKTFLYNYDITIQNCTFYRCGTGVDFRATDGTIDNIYAERNLSHGLYVAGSNNKISNIKSIWNGSDNHSAWGIYINGHRNQVVNIEAQDNYCNGIRIEGDDNQCYSVLSDCNGYESAPETPSEPYATLIKVVGTRNTVYGKCTQYKSISAVAKYGIDSSRADNDCRINVTVEDGCCTTNNIKVMTNIESYLDHFIPLPSEQSHTLPRSLGYGCWLIVGYMQTKGGFLMAVKSNSPSTGTVDIVKTHIAGADVTSFMTVTKGDGTVTLSSNNDFYGVIITN